jgi:hypothetical protein
MLNARDVGSSPRSRSPNTAEQTTRTWRDAVRWVPVVSITGRRQVRPQSARFPRAWAIRVLRCTAAEVAALALGAAMNLLGALLRTGVIGTVTTGIIDTPAGPRALAVVLRRCSVRAPRAG